ncbi:iron-containing alcohol dehydrogenase [Lacticaseibacillus sp. GG6-2]
MEDFTFYNPTEIRFGDHIDAELATTLKKFGTRVLLVYGGQSIHRSGLYDRVQKLLAGFDVVELAGVEPNPKIASVRAGQQLAHDRDVILAVGGGSVVDCAKVIAMAAHYDGDPWSLVVDRKLAAKQAMLPLVDILTLAATGTEMNINAVISDPDQHLKLGARCPHGPAVSFLDPRLTTTVPASQTAAGSMDIFSHLCEQYFDRATPNDASAGMIEGLMRTVITWAPVAITHPDNLDARRNLMWTATAALNGFVGAGTGSSWSCHAMEHQLSAVYDVTHGVGLGILTPRWMQYCLDHDASTRAQFQRFGHRVWDLPANADPQAAIDATYAWINNLGFGMTLPAIGIKDDSHFAEMAARAAAHGLTNAYVPLDQAAVTSIYQASMTLGTN